MSKARPGNEPRHPRRSERLVPILMTALVTATGCCCIWPLGQWDAGREIEGPWPPSLGGSPLDGIENLLVLPPCVALGTFRQTGPGALSMGLAPTTTESFPLRRTGSGWTAAPRRIQSRPGTGNENASCGQAAVRASRALGIGQPSTLPPRIAQVAISNPQRLDRALSAACALVIHRRR